MAVVVNIIIITCIKIIITIIITGIIIIIVVVSIIIRSLSSSSLLSVLLFDHHYCCSCYYQLIGTFLRVQVSRETHSYTTDIEAREEGGTPAIIESIRTGLAFQLKDAVSEKLIAARDEDLCWY